MKTVKESETNATSETFFSIEKFKKSLKKWIRSETKHSYAETTNPPKELIFADNSNFPTLSKAEWEFLKGIIKETLAEDDLIVNKHKTEPSWKN